MALFQPYKRWSSRLDRFLLSRSLQSVVVIRGSSPMTDIRNRQVVGEGICFRIPEKSNGAPSHEQLLENQAQLLKLELSQAAEHCINEFGARTLKPNDLFVRLRYKFFKYSDPMNPA